VEKPMDKAQIKKEELWENKELLDSMHNFAYKLTGNLDWADDVFQDACLKLHKSPREELPIGIIFRAVYTCSCDFLKKQPKPPPMPPAFLSRLKHDTITADHTRRLVEQDTEAVVLALLQDQVGIAVQLR